MEYLRSITNTTKTGTNAYYLTLCAQSFGFSTNVVEGELENLNMEMLPCIAQVIINDKFKHFVVVHEVKQNNIVIADPAKGLVKMKKEDFAKISTKKYILLRPLKKIPIMKSEKQFIRLFIKSLLCYKKELFTVFTFSFLYTLINIITSYSFQIVLEDSIYINSIKNLYFISFIILFLILLKNTLDYLRVKILNYVNCKIDFILMTSTFSHIISFPYQYYKNKTTGDILSRINDLSSIRDSFSNFFLYLFVDSLLVFFLVFFLIKINLYITLINIIILIVYIIIVKIFNNLLNELIINGKNVISDVNTNIVESLEIVDTIKGLNLENNFKNKFIKIYSKYIKINFKFNNMHNFENLLKNLIDGIGSILILIIGAVFVLKNKMTIGELITYNALVVYFLEPIKNIINSDINIKEAKQAIRRIVDIYNIQEESVEIDSKYMNNPIKGDIIFNNLSYSYNGRDKIIDCLDLKIKEGQKVLLSGCSGSGKSTLMKLIMKFYEVDNNMISINYKDINDYNLLELRRDICYVSQNEKLLTDSVYNNIVLDRNISYDDFLYVANIFDVEEIVKKDISKYNMLLEENGFNISGGERQRIILARTLLKKSNIYIFDESFSQIDIELERTILSKLFKYLKNKTVIVISHRFDNNDLYDDFYKIEKGKICYEK